MNILKRSSITLVASLLIGGALGVPAHADADTADRAAQQSSATKTAEDSKSDAAPTAQAPMRDFCEEVDTSSGEGECQEELVTESYSEAHSSTEVESGTVNGVDIHSAITVLANIRANGTPKAQQTDCFRTPKAISAWTSYNAEGTTGWHWKYYPAGYRFCNVNGVVRDPACHNQVKIGRPHSKPPKNAISGEVKFVKRLKWKIVSVSEVEDSVKAGALAWSNGYLVDQQGNLIFDGNGQPINTCHAESMGEGSASFYAKGKGMAKGRVLSKVLLAAHASGAGDLQLQLQAQGVVDVHAHTKSKARGKARADASAYAKCQNTVQQSQQNVRSGEIVSGTQHAYQGDKITVKGVGTSSKFGNNVTLSFQLTNVATIPNHEDCTAADYTEGVNRVKRICVSPTGAPGSTATIKLVVTDAEGSAVVYTLTFPILSNEGNI